MSDDFAVMFADDYGSYWSHVKSSGYLVPYTKETDKTHKDKEAESIKFDNKIFDCLMSRCTMLTQTKFIMPSLLNPYIHAYDKSDWSYTVTYNDGNYEIVVNTLSSWIRKSDDIIKGYFKNIIDNAITNGINYFYNYSSSCPSECSEFHGIDKYTSLIDDICNIFKLHNKCSLMVHEDLDLAVIKKIQMMLQYELHRRGIFAMSVFDANTTKDINDIMTYLNQSTQLTPVIVSFTDIFDCYSNIISGKYNKSHWVASKKSINDFYDKMEHIPGLISLTFCSKSRKVLNDTITSEEEKTGTPYKSMYRKGRIDYYVDLTTDDMSIINSE